MPALRNLDTLEKVTGVSGEIDVTVRSKNVATPATVQWMIALREPAAQPLRLPGGEGLRRGHAVPGAVAARPVLQRQPVGRPSAAADPGADQRRSWRRCRRYFSQAVITPDHREATLAFGIRLMPLSRQEQVIDYMRAHLHPPAGTTAALAGLPVLAAEANASLSSDLASLPHADRGPARRGARPAGWCCARPRPRAGAAGPDRHGHRLVGAHPVPDRDPAQPDVGHAGDAGHRHLHRVQRPAVRALPPGARGGARPARGAAPDLPLHRRRGPGLRGDRDRRLRRAGLLEHHDAARLRLRDADRPVGVAAGRAARAARGAGAVRARGALARGAGSAARGGSARLRLRRRPRVA